MLNCYGVTAATALLVIVTSPDLSTDSGSLSGHIQHMVIARRCCNSVRPTRNRWLKLMLWVSWDWSWKSARLLSSLDVMPFGIFLAKYIKAGVHKFSKSLVVTSKLQAPEGWQRQIRYWGPNNIGHHCTKLSRPGNLAYGICAPLH